MATNTEKVIFADDEATIHKIEGEVETNEDGSLYEPHISVVLLPGQFVDFSEVPSYLQESVTKGEAPGLSLRTVAEAKKLAKDAEAMTVRSYEPDELTTHKQETVTDQQVFL